MIPLLTCQNLWCAKTPAGERFLPKCAAAIFFLASSVCFKPRCASAIRTLISSVLLEPVLMRINFKRCSSGILVPKENLLFLFLSSSFCLAFGVIFLPSVPSPPSVRLYPFGRFVFNALIMPFSYKSISSFVPTITRGTIEKFSTPCLRMALYRLGLCNLFRSPIAS